MVLHQFEHLRIAQAFSDYLHSLNIDNRIEHDEFHYQLILAHTEKLSQAQQELAEFLANPNQRKYLAASWQSGKVSDLNQHSPELASANANLLSNFKAHGGMITHSIFIICIIIYGLIMLGLLQPMQSVLAFFTQQPFDLLQAWRFVTPAFLHFSLLHIVFNLLWWWQLGGVIEKQHGKQRLFILFIFSAIASNLAQYYLVGPYFGGLSGVVYALVGYTWLYGLLNKQSRVNMPNAMFLILIGWLVLGFLDWLPAHVANYAHLLGLVSGLIVAAICSKLKH